MTQNLKQDLADRVEPAQWKWLIPHASRDALVVVHGDLELPDVGVAIASDNAVQVNRWIEEGLLTKPTETQLNQWQRCLQKQFRSLIVQPFVLIQAMPDA